MSSEETAGKATQPSTGVSRRSLLRSSALVGAGVIGGAAIGAGTTAAVQASPNPMGTQEPFYGKNQSGVLTNTQRNAVLASFDLVDCDKTTLVTLLKSWTKLASELVTGNSYTVPIMPVSAAAAATNAYSDATDASTTDDSFEAYQLGPQRLTLTVGFGRSMFVDSNGKDRMGFAGKLPPALVELPHFSGDQINEADSGGDLFLQACADDPQVAFHAVRSIARIAPDVATLRWTQLGYSPTNDGGTPRNLMGFKDGTVNSNAHPPSNPNATVWAGSEGPAWMNGGSYLVYRRIRITLEHWDRIAPPDQEQVFGRTKLTGAPLSGGTEFTPMNLTARGSDGQLLIPSNAHARLASPMANNGAVILRRAFAYNNGTTQFVERWPPWRQALEYDAGLLFLAYQKDPRTAFIPINTNLALNDAMNQFTTHTASAVFAMPPGVSGPNDWFGSTLLS